MIVLSLGLGSVLPAADGGVLPTVDADEKVDVFKEGHMAEDVLPILAQRALRAAQERSEDDTAEIAALIEHEMNFMQTLVTGSALSEHMEDFYLDTLRALATTDASAAVAGIVAEVTQSSGDLKA